MKDDTTIIFTSKERRMLKSMNKKLSEADLASALKVSVTTIRRWIQGKLTPPYAVRLLITKVYEEYKNGKSNIQN